MAALTIAKHLFKRKRAATTTTVPAGSKYAQSSSSPMSSPSLITATSFATTSDSRSESSRSRRRTPVVVASMMMMAIPASSALGSRTTLASSIAQPSATTTVAVTTPTTTTVTATTTATDATLSCIEGFQDEPILPGTSMATTEMSSTTIPATRTGSFLKPRRATAKHSSTRPLSSYDCNRPLPPLPPQTAAEGATCCMDAEAETEATSPQASAPQRSNTTPVKPLAFFSLPIRLGGTRSRPRSGVCATTENARFWQQQPPKKADKQQCLHPMAHAASSLSLSTLQSTLTPLPLHKAASSPSPLRRGHTLPAEERSKECLGQPCMHMHSQPIANVQPKQTILPITRLKRQPTKLFRRFSSKFGGSTETLPTSETVAQEYARTIKALWQMVEEEELSQRIADATPEEREWIIRQYSSTPVANHPFLRQYQNESSSSLGLGIVNGPIQAISNTNSSSSSSSTMFPFHENASWTTDGESTSTAHPNQINHILKTRLHSPQYLSPLHRVSPQEHKRQQDSNTCQSRLFGEDETDDEQGPTPDQLQRRRKSQLVYGQADYEAQMSNVSLPDAYGVTVSTPVLTTLVSSAMVGKRGRSATQVSSRVWQFAQELQKRDQFTIEERMHLEDEWRLQGRFQRAGPGCRPASMVLLQRRATQVEDGAESPREDRWIEALKSGGPWPNNESCATFVGSENGTEDDERGETAVIKVARKVSVRQSLRVPAHHAPVLLSQP